MVGMRAKCQGCGAPLRKDYEYCNICGRKISTIVLDAPRSVPVNTPRALPMRKVRPTMMKKTAGESVPRRDLVLTLLVMACMAPLTTWESAFGGLLGASAIASDTFYGRYVLLLAAGGLFVLLAGSRIPDIVPRRWTIVGVSAGMVTLTALDCMDMVRYNMDVSSSLAKIEPGIGMYMTVAIGALLLLAVLIPERKGATAGAELQVLRPGSRGSGL